MRALVPTSAMAEAVARSSFTGSVVAWQIDAPEPPPDCEVVVTARPGDLAHARRLHEMPSLRHLHLLSLGYDWVGPYLPSGVRVTNSAGAVEASTAEHAVALLLAAQRDLPRAAEQQRARHWQELWTSSLAGAGVLLLGYGGVGTAIARRVWAFEPASVVPVARHARVQDGVTVHGVDELPALLPAADVVVCSLPLLSSTTGLIDAAFLDRMPPGALLVNVGRGGVVDTAALLDRLRQGRLRAALDVVDPEPLPPEHPLWEAPNLLLTPHIGGNTGHFVALVTDLTIRQLCALAAGDEPINVIDPHT